MKSVRRSVKLPACQNWLLCWAVAVDWAWWSVVRAGWGPCWLGVLLCVWPGSGGAQEAANLQFGTLGALGQSPIQISAESLEINEGSQVVTFLGDVVITWEAARMTAEQVHVVYAASDTDAGFVVTRVDALGDVRIEETARRVWGRRATYLPAQGSIDVRGHVRFEQGPVRVEGAHLKVDVNRGQAKMLSGPENEGGQVRASFVPQP